MSGRVVGKIEVTVSGGRRLARHERWDLSAPFVATLISATMGLRLCSGTSEDSQMRGSCSSNLRVAVPKHPRPSVKGGYYTFGGFVHCNLFDFTRRRRRCRSPKFLAVVKYPALILRPCGCNPGRTSPRRLDPIVVACRLPG